MLTATLGMQVSTFLRLSAPGDVVHKYVYNYPIGPAALTTRFVYQ